jgi:hypothetical protein
VKTTDRFQLVEQLLEATHAVRLPKVAVAILIMLANSALRCENVHKLSRFAQVYVLETD